MALKEKTMDTKVTRKQMVLDTLLQAKREGSVSINGKTLETPQGFIDGSMLTAIAGPTALRRLRELRTEGYQIQMRREGRSAQYRLTRVKPVKG